MEIGKESMEKYLEEAKEEFSEEGEITLKGDGRDISKTVDVAEELKIEGAKVENIDVETVKEDDKRFSKIIIKLEK